MQIESESHGLKRPSRILFVREVPRDLDNSTVEELFNKHSGFVCLRRLPQFTFVEYNNEESATIALQALQGYVFRSGDRPLSIDFDKDARDSRKRKGDSVGEERDSKKRDSSSSSSSSSSFSRFHRDDYRRDNNPPPLPRFPEIFSFPQFPFGPPNPPQDCSTLYVSALPKDVTERELSILFRFMPGFSRVRLVVRDGKAPICFADFLDGPSATYALQTLQGFRLDMRDSFGLHIEFDKNHRSFSR